MIQGKGQLSEVEVARVAGKGRKLSPSSWDTAKQGIKNEQLKARIREFEQENVGKRQDYEKGLTDAMDHFHTVTQKVDEVGKMC
jgi:hypothetical protein